ncbi:trypsin-like cysteine/serine peptidase domain-containing protein [Hyaloraphidium curvatum]|nr:trypsin-like cysteine/serine peptidase domain-containing protein [Hyaloraphidium curvatum]
MRPPGPRRPRPGFGLLCAAALLSALAGAFADPDPGSTSGQLMGRNVTLGALVPNVVGGSPVLAQYVFPWMVRLVNSYRGWSCGGTMIAPNVVLTAGHCVRGTQASEWLASTYRRNISLSSSREGGTDYRPRLALVHPRFDSFTLQWDAAVLVLGPPTRYGRAAFTPRWIAINRNPAFPRAGTRTTVLGWGKLGEAAGFPRILQRAGFPVASNDECGYYLGGQYYPGTMICAGAPGVDACNGDSGGPLFATVNGTQVLVGIVSWGAEGTCASPDFIYGAYSRVSAVAPWVDSVLRVYAPQVLPRAGRTTSRRRTTTVPGRR